MELVHRTYEIAVVVGVLVGLATVVASRAGSWGHIGAQLAALRGPVGLANVAASCLGVAIGAWVPAMAAGVFGSVALLRSAPVGVNRRPEARTGSDVTLTTANVLVHNRRFGELAQRLLDQGADVLLLQEVTPAHAAALRELVRRRTDLHVLAEPRDDYSGWATLSRHPVLSRGRIDMPNWPISWVVVDHPVMPIRFVNVHTAAPQAADDEATWRSQLARLAGFADGSFPTVLAGDFNATGDHRSFRRLLDAGFSDAFDRAGRGWGATWPAHRVAVPLLRLDHVLVDRSLVVHAIETIDLVGSDHRGLRVELRAARTGVGAPSRSGVEIDGSDVERWHGRDQHTT